LFLPNFKKESKKEMQKKVPILLVTLFLWCNFVSLSYSQIMNITNCGDLQAVITNNSTVSYQILNLIDCSNYIFSVLGNPGNVPFQGTLDVLERRICK